ncbi:MAG: hypothetical protein Q8M26_14570 [Pseudolabrys sp.]|nr:hypothetical protein [Pseudolabrys sp.]
MKEQQKDRSCEARVEKHMQGRLDDLRALWAAFLQGRADDALGSLNEYALCFDYVAPGIFDGQTEGYFRYQISYGGPSDEFRFFVNPDFTVHRIEYWFLDWFDGAHRVLQDEPAQGLRNLWDWLSPAGMVLSAYRQAQR